MKSGVWILGLGISLLVPSLCRASDETCYDFDRPKQERLKGAPELKLPKSGASEDKGKAGGGVDWAALRTRLNKPITSVYALIRDHRIGKDTCKTTLESRFEKKKGYLDFETLSISANVWAFITVDWVENWAYELLSGTPSKPTAIRAYYQKIKGSSHIRRLCGFIEIKALDPKHTDTYFYEEIKATRIDATATLGKHREAVRKILGQSPLECQESK
ncbi:MAG: hypothetical protein H6617_07740 [Bdellovibrionaceae bacterium]|nr:hypothetical protein [Bdellovibrionales bacterium]MCB9254558.1 hypothetical protein [Pseudobdellovibrionaceae bacterium]